MDSPRLEDTVDTIARECIAVRTRVLSRAISQLYDEALRPLGIKVSQLNVLIVVAKLEPASPGEVAGRLNMEKSTLSRNVERMRTRGWIEVSEAPAGRGQVLVVGQAGRRLIEDAWPHWRQAQQRAEALLGVDGLRSVRAAAAAVWKPAVP